MRPTSASTREYDYRKGQRLTGYRVVRQMTAKVRDLDRLGDVLDGLVAAGANEVHGAQMSASDPSAAEHEALRAAITAARAKADALAEAGGVTLGRPRPGRGGAGPRAADAEDADDGRGRDGRGRARPRSRPAT